MFSSKYTWQVRQKTGAISDDLVKTYKLSDLEKTLLENRGYYEAEDIDTILRPNDYNWQ